MKKTLVLLSVAAMLGAAPAFAGVTTATTTTKTVKSGNCDTHPKSAACLANKAKTK